MALKSLTDENFKKEVKESGKASIVQFSAAWCNPCKVLKPIMEEVSDEMSNKLNFFYMDIDESPSTPTLFSIRGVPTLIQFDEKGEQKGIKVGATTKSNVISFINENI
jgi:thioredoxin 1